MPIHLASDHAGFEHKEAVANWLGEEGYTVIDHGAHTFSADDDFPDFIGHAAAAVSKRPQADRAIVFGGSGQGEAIVANRYPNVRGAVLYADNEDIVRLSREHNDANLLSIGARFLSIDDTKRLTWVWLHTEASSTEKYQRRNKKIETITNQIKP